MPVLRQPNRLNNLVRVYHDLESTLRGLTVTRASVEWVDRGFQQINVSKLVSQLSKSKRKIERKIRKGLQLEKALLRQRLRTFVGIRKELRRGPLGPSA